MTDTDVGVIGLGRMGSAIAGRLVERGHDVSGFDVDDGACARLEDVGGTALDSPRAVAEASRIVVTSLPSSEILESTYLGDDGVVAGVDGDFLGVEASTVDPDVDETIARAVRDAGGEYIDAPVSGGPENCASGTLTIMVGGSRSVYEGDVAQAVLDDLGENVSYVGDVGAGHMMKLLNNSMSMGNLLLAMEAVSLGVEWGLEGETILDALENAGAASNAFLKRMPRVLNRNFEPGFSVDHARKDTGLAVDVGDDVDQPMLAGSLVHQMYTRASAEGLGDEDIGAVVKLFEATMDSPVEADREVDETFGGY